MLQLLLLLAPLALSQRATTPATPFFPFEGIDDPSKQCLDIFCYEPITWSDDKKEVCRFKKERACTPRSEEVCIDVPVTTCEVVGYTECSERENPQPLRDDKVVGEFFYEQTCETRPISITEMKMKPECVNQTKNVCEKMWIKEAPYWKDVNCQQLAWENCTMVPHPHEVEIDFCECKPTEIWYNKFEKKDAMVNCLSSSCVPKAVPVCKTTPKKQCTTVTWEECKETCTDECSEQHFKEPSQEADHRRWCSHVEILLPPGVTAPRAPRALNLNNQLPAPVQRQTSQTRTVVQRQPDISQKQTSQTRTVVQRQPDSRNQDDWRLSPATSQRRNSIQAPRSGRQQFPPRHTRPVSMFVK